VDRMLSGNELDLEELERTARVLPTGWWAPISSESLINLLREEESTDWLISNPLPWCAAVLRPIGEGCQAPGLRSYTHPGCDPEIHSLLIRRLRGRREREGLPDSAAPLLDLMEALDAINEGRPPSPGRTHPLSGWLAQPVGKWPEFSASVALDGDAEIAERLLLRSSGYHAGIVPSTSISG